MIKHSIISFIRYATRMYFLASFYLQCTINAHEDTLADVFCCSFLCLLLSISFWTRIQGRVAPTCHSSLTKVCSRSRPSVCSSSNLTCDALLFKSNTKENVNTCGRGGGNFTSATAGVLLLPHSRKQVDVQRHVSVWPSGKPIRPLVCWKRRSVSKTKRNFRTKLEAMASRTTHEAKLQRSAAIALCGSRGNGDTTEQTIRTTLQAINASSQSLI